MLRLFDHGFRDEAGGYTGGIRLQPHPLGRADARALSSPSYHARSPSSNRVREAREIKWEIDLEQECSKKYLDK